MGRYKPPKKPINRGQKDIKLYHITRDIIGSVNSWNDIQSEKSKIGIQDVIDVLEKYLEP